MMRLLVLSDSHGDYISLKMAIDNTRDADVIVFLGDGINDIERISETPIVADKRIISVRGNCDGSFCGHPALAIENLGGIKVYCTHGYNEKVKYGYQMLMERATDAGATLALFGHTHTPYTSYENGLYVMNPGSVRENSCGIADITPNGILCFTKKIVT